MKRVYEKVYATTPHTVGTGIVYCIHNLITNKKYIGSTTILLCKRLGNHRMRGIAHFDTHPCIAAEIERVPVEQLLEREDYWIKKLDTANTGYNTMYRGWNNGRNQQGSNNIHSSTWKVTFNDGREEIHHSLVELIERGYNKVGLSELSTGKRKYHKDITGVIKL